MQNDLFQKLLTKKEQLLRWIKAQHYAPTHAVMEWGLQNKHIRADRDCRDLCQAGNIRRMTEDEKIVSRWAKLHEEIWVFIHD